MKPTTSEQANLPAGATLDGKSTASPLRTKQRGGVGAKHDETDKSSKKKHQAEGKQGQLIPAAAASAMTKLCPVRLRGVGSFSPKKSPRRRSPFSSPTKKKQAGYKIVSTSTNDDDDDSDPPTTPLREGHPSSSGAAAEGGRLLAFRGAASPSGTCTSSSSDEGAADGVGTPPSSKPAVGITAVQWRAPPPGPSPPRPTSSPRERALAGFCRDATTAEDLEDPILMMQSVTTTTTAPADLGGGGGCGGCGGEGDDDEARAVPNDTEKNGRTVELELDRDEEEDEKEDPEEDDPKEGEADGDAPSSRRRRRRRRRGGDDDDDDPPPLSGKFLVFHRLRSEDEDEEDVGIGGGANDDDDPLTISPQTPAPAPLLAPSVLRMAPSVVDGRDEGEEGGGSDDGVGEVVGDSNGNAPPPPSPSPSKGVTFAPPDNPALSSPGASNNDNKRRTQEFTVNESDQHKSLPELLQTISVLRDRLSRASVDFSGEKALRRRKEKNLIKLARELNIMAQALREKDVQMKKLLVNQAALEEKLGSLGEQLENETRRSERTSRDHHNEITLYQTKLRSSRREFEEAASSRARQADELRGRLLATSLECDRMRVTCAKMEMMRQTAASGRRDIVRGTMLDAKVTQRQPGNDERRWWRLQWFGEANCLARVTGALSRALVIVAFSVLLLLVVGCIAVVSWGDALSVHATRNVLCAPTPPGTVLEASASASASSSPQSLTYDAPWWAPPRYKARAYDALCHDDKGGSSTSDDHSTSRRPRRRQRCRLEWSSRGGAGTGTLTTTTLGDGRVWNRVGGISRARVGPFGALVPARRRRRIFRRGRVDEEVFLPGPWAL